MKNTIHRALVLDLCLPSVLWSYVWCCMERDWTGRSCSSPVCGVQVVSQSLEVCWRLQPPRQHSQWRLVHCSQPVCRLLCQVLMPRCILLT